MSIGPDIGGDIADAPSHGDILHADIVNLDIVLDFLEVREFGDIPFRDFELEELVETVITNEEVREVVAKRVAEAQAQGRAFPLPSAREIADARERALARLQKRA
jgi:hypothetical protein